MASSPINLLDPGLGIQNIMDPGTAGHLPDARPLASSAMREAGLDELYTLTKTRGYAHARVRRLVLYAFLGLHLNDRPASPPYLRVLGFGERGKVLKLIRSLTGG